MNMARIDKSFYFLQVPIIRRQWVFDSLYRPPRGRFNYSNPFFAGDCRTSHSLLVASELQCVTTWCYILVGPRRGIISSGKGKADFTLLTGTRALENPRLSTVRVFPLAKKRLPRISLRGLRKI